MKHIEFATLVDKLDGKLSADMERDIDLHVEACGSCETKYRKLAGVFAYSLPTETEQVSQATTARILNIYQRKPVPSEPAKPERRGFASLIFDDWQTALNERYSGLDSRQMLYRLGEFDIDLRIELVGDNCRLTGQLFPESAGATAEMYSADIRQIAELNEFGEFAFDLVPQGVYDIGITVGNHNFQIEQVSLQH